MNQRDRTNCATNGWEADPWDASEETAGAQLAGFALRAAKPIEWSSIRTSGPTVFGIEVKTLINADVEFHAMHDGEELLLMQLVWHGFPDPPEWRLVSRPHEGGACSWTLWGYFGHLPPAWRLPEARTA